MRNIFLFLIFSVFFHSFSYALPNDVMSSCNLPAPGNLHSVEVGPSYATLAWDGVPGAIGYQISWYDDSGSQLGAEQIIDTEYEVLNLESGKTYTVRVASVCVAGNPSPIYSIVPIVPITVELVISSDNPLGNLTQVCSQAINPVAECTFDFAVATTYIGKIDFLDLGKVYYFRVRYFNYETKGSTSKVVIDLVNPLYYSGISIKNPKLLTENGDPTGLIFHYASARKGIYEFAEIKITKIKDTEYKISVLDMSGQSNSILFTFFNPSSLPKIEPKNDFETTENKIISIFGINSLNQEETNSEKLKLFNINGALIFEFGYDESLESIYNHISQLHNGLYILTQIKNGKALSEKIVIYSK